MRRKRKVKKKKKGFTLIELLVVIAILGILSTLGIISFKSSQVKARDAQRKSDLKQITQAMEMYYNDHQKYPESIEGQVNGISWGEKFEDETGTIYMQSLPNDPRGSLSYFYETDELGSYYKIYAKLENINDSSIQGEYEKFACDPQENNCNYCISSSNINCTPTTPTESTPTSAPPVPTNTPIPVPTNTPIPTPTPTTCPTGTCQTTQPGCLNYCSSSCQTFYGPACQNNPVPGTWYIGCGCRSKGELCMGMCPSVMCCDGLGCGIEQKCK